MADIDVVKKKSSTWVWLVAALAVLVLAWLLWSSMRTEDSPGQTGPMGWSHPTAAPPLGAAERPAA